MTFVLVAVLISGNGTPTSFAVEFNSQRSCETAKEVLRETTQLRVDTLRCVQK